MQRAPRAHSCVLCEIYGFGTPRPAAGRPCLKHGIHKSTFLALCEFCERERRPRAGGGALVARPRHPTLALWDFVENIFPKNGRLVIFFYFSIRDLEFSGNFFHDQFGRGAAPRAFLCTLRDSRIRGASAGRGAALP